MTVNPRDYLFVVHDAPNCMMSRALALWFTALDVWQNVRFLNTGDRNMDCQTNAGIFMALETNAAQFVFVESDIRPHVGITKGFWESAADVVGCIYPTEEERAWDLPFQIHTGLWRTRREILEAIEPPWFAWKYNQVHSRTTGCICSTFWDKLRKAGFSTAQAGHAHHVPRPAPAGLTRRQPAVTQNSRTEYTQSQ